MIDAVERRIQVYKTDQRDILTVGDGIDVGQDYAYQYPSLVLLSSVFITPKGVTSAKVKAN